ncbi:hypothetical protein DFH05DRAFT_1468529 [Lentinula detonsa]|uniref:Uncharacterized protein n=1 Tax=Lentinula detonsa TaxID=2804962 RepID=A0A9W8PBG5_9AGAR|nr:hypothetical protein DFH05DRAFT_1468529 [Lentinula detonsa]
MVIDKNLFQSYNSIKMNSHNLPPLPKIDGDVDLTLAVFTYQSYTSPSQPTEYDSDRLAELGEQVLDLAVTNYLYCKQPALDAQNIRDQRRAILRDEKIVQWLDSYNLKTKLRTPDPRILENPQEMKKFFLIYIGAVYISSEMSIVENWIVQLIDPDAAIQNTASASASYSSQHSSSMPPQYSAPPPAPPRSSPPPLPPDYPPSSTSPTPLLWLSLATVNQTAAQKHVNISYQAEPTVGPPHAPTWTVHCYIDGQDRGVGRGKSQKVAKEEAARNAYVQLKFSTVRWFTIHLALSYSYLNMGWMPNV